MSKESSLFSIGKNWLATNGRYLLNLGSTFASQGVTAIVLLVLTPFLVSHLGESNFSTYGVLLNLILVTSVFDFGLNTGLVHRLIQEPQHRNLLLNAVFFFYLIIFFLVFPIVYLLFRTDWVSFQGEQWRVAFILASIVAQNMLAMFFEAIFQSVNKIFLSKWIRVLRTLIEAVLLYWVSKQGSVELLLLTSMGVNFLFLTALFVLASQQTQFTLRWHFFKVKTLVSQLHYSFWYFQSMLATVIAYNIQILLLNHFLSPVQMTIFLLVFRFFEVFRTGLTNFTFVLFPSISAMQAQKDWMGIRQQFQRVFGTVFMLSALVFAFMLWKGNDLFSWWSKYDTLESKQVFQVYAFYVFLLVIDHVSVVFLSALKYNRAPSILSTLQSAASLLLTAILLESFGLQGAVWGSLLAFALTSLIFNPAYLVYRIKKEIA